jgi:hypothetical protein
MPPAVLLRLVAQVRRRVVLASLLSLLAWAWLAAVALSAGWFFLQPLLIHEAPPWLRWAVLGGSLAAATASAIIFGILRAPSRLGAAMSLDERFNLRERVTTSLTLDADTAATPAGQALLADAEQRANQVRVADRFPVAVPWKPAAMLPVCGAALVLLALLWNPHFVPGSNGGDDENPPTEPNQAVEDQMKKLAQAKPAAKKGEDEPKAEDLKRIEAEIEKFVQKPRDRRDEIQDRIKDATAIEAELQRQQKRQAERADALREALKQAERLKRKNKDNKNQQGPGKDAADALARGDMEKAKDELQRLAKDLEKDEQKERLKKNLKDPNLGKEEKEELQRELEKLEKEGKQLDGKDKEDLQKQIEEMKDMVERLTRKQEEQEKELREMEKAGEIDKEELERELEEMKKNELTDEEKKELEELAKDLAECEKCMNEGKQGEAAKKLAKAAKKCEGACKKGEQGERAKMLARMQAVRKALNRQMVQGGPGGPAAGKRPEAKSDVDKEETHVKGEWDKGKVEVVGEGPKGGKKFDGPRKPTDMKEEIKQAGQEAAAAIDRQRLPPSARKMARDYFEKVRVQDKEKDAKKP